MFHASSSAVAGDRAKSHASRVAPAPDRPSRPGWWRALWFRRDSRIADIRHLMLEQSAAVADPDRRSALCAQIAAATTPQTLWSLRQDLMQALVAVHGEMLARQRLTNISFMFAGLLDCPRHAVADDMPPPGDWPASASPQLRTDH